jgi:hypothetical protein
MRTIRLKAVIDQNHQLHLQLPPDMPVGEADVVVTIDSSVTAANAASAASLRETLARLDADPRPRLSAEEMDRWIEDERNAWE